VLRVPTLVLKISALGNVSSLFESCLSWHERSFFLLESSQKKSLSCNKRQLPPETLYTKTPSPFLRQRYRDTERHGDIGKARASCKWEIDPVSKEEEEETRDASLTAVTSMCSLRMCYLRMCSLRMCYLETSRMWRIDPVSKEVEETFP
jgi:hypothetical protein